MKYKIGVWGQFGDGGKIADGQAVRTTIITKELQMRYGNESVGIVNTNGWKSHPLKFLFESFQLVRDSTIVVVAPADNGYKVFVPLLLLFNMFYRRALIHVVIGGFLPALLKDKPIYLKFENKFSAVFVQTENLKRDLEHLGVCNISILSNLKRLNTLPFDEIIKKDDQDVRVCVFSRINKEKGIEDAVEAVKIANTKMGRTAIKLDMYGLVQPGYEQTLQEVVKDNRGFAEYKGIVDYDKTVETLSGYFVMMFPTYYYGEGFPGNVVDAYNSGLPIIATDWLYNKDVIVDGRNGILVPIKSPLKLADALLTLYNDRDLHFNMIKNNIEDSRQYHPDVVLKEFYAFIDAYLTSQVSCKKSK